MCLYIPANPDGVLGVKSWAGCLHCRQGADLRRWLPAIHAGIRLHAGPRSASPCIQVAAAHRTMRPGSSRASRYQHAGRHRSATATDDRTHLTMQASSTDTAQPLQIDPGRDRASSPIVGHQDRLHATRRGAHGSRNRFADNVSHLLCDACCRKSVQCVMTGHENRIGQIGQM